MIFEGSINTTHTINNFPEGKEIQFHTDADVTVAFWFPATNSWGDEIPIIAPGNFLGVGSGKARVTGTANVRIL